MPTLFLAFYQFNDRKKVPNQMQSINTKLSLFIVIEQVARKVAKPN